MEIQLMIFTPTYNRATLLPRVFSALKRQTCRRFAWMVVDDGSTDNTAELVTAWQQEADFPIFFHRKENGGLYTGYHVAIQNTPREYSLMMCIDSDDYPPDNAVELVVKLWESQGDATVAGIIGLDFTTEGELLGDPFPEQLTINSIDLLLDEYRLNNMDRKYVVRTELYRNYDPGFDFPDEKDFNPQYIHLRIAKDYDFLVLNENLCFVEYQPDGMTNTIFKQYVRSPRSFAVMRLQNLSFPNAPWKFRIKNHIHFIASCLIAHEKRFVHLSPQPFLTFLLLPVGAIFSLWIRKKAADCN